MIFAVQWKRRNLSRDVRCCTDWPFVAGTRLIAEYSTARSACTVSVIECGAPAPLLLARSEDPIELRAVPAPTLERGLELAREMISWGE